MARALRIFLCVLALIALFAFLAKQADLALLDPAGPIAGAERNLMILATALMLIVVIPVFILLFSFAWRYRDVPGNTAAYMPDWEHSRLDEFIWWAVPIAIIAALSIPTWISSHTLDPYRPIASSVPTERVEVVALDWRWLFIYPVEGVATIDELTIPENTPIELDITADAPMNSLWIPRLSGQIMCMPGMVTKLNILADGEGTYTGLSGNFSGEGFAGMRFTVHSVSRSAFDAWISRVRQAPASLTKDSYAALAQPTSSSATEYFSSVDPNLYDSIVMKYMAPSAATSTMHMQMPMP